jgi:crossover junction endodeoxyribonuclease RuvC
MKVLALDCGTHTGWAVGEDGRRVLSGVQVFDVKRGESAGMRFLRFNAWLRELAQLAGPFDVVAFELAHHRGGAATELTVGMTTRAQEAAAEWKCENVGVHTGTLKKRTTGSGAAKKPEMIEAARARWRVDPQDDNEADALCLLSLIFEDYAARAVPAAGK